MEDKFMTDYALLGAQLTALLQDEHSPIANLANASALVKQSVAGLNWVGFYLYDEKRDTLDLGPFQGHVACMHIKLGHGVCGVAGQKQTVQVVADVTKFPGYISCDAAAQSELVIPLVKSNGQLYGVFDLDAPVKNRFDQELVTALKQVARILMQSIDEPA